MRELKTVLLVDDNIHDNYIHTHAIRKVTQSLDIRTVTAGDEALDYFHKSISDPQSYPYPDMVFLDINMPRMNGFEFVEKGREENVFEKGRPLMVVMLTSSLNPYDLERARNLFENDILEFKNKPLTPEMFKEIVDLHFNEKE
ncbi:MAG TPA: response regulator [Lentimicrobium sp.]|nr:response regulator [Lentimicrobium sp.]